MTDHQKTSDMPEDALRVWPDLAHRMKVDRSTTLQLLDEYQVSTTRVGEEVWVSRSALRGALARASQVLDEMRAFIANLESQL